jgi:uncharacterized protein
MIRPLIPDDQSHLEMFLQKHRASSMFLLSNIARSGIVEGDQPFQGAYAAAFDQDKIIGVAAHYWNGNVMLQTGTRLDNAGALVRAVVSASKRGLRGLIGDADQCKAAQRSLGLSDTQFQLHESDGLYTLVLSQMVTSPLAQHARLATDADRDALNQMYADFEVEALNETNLENAREHAKKVVAMRIEHRMQYVLEIDRVIVAASTFSATSMPTVQIGGVWTPKNLRSRGFARACVAGSLALAQREGALDAVLSTGDDNVSAIKSYEAIGFQKIARYFIGLLREPVHFT